MSEAKRLLRQARRARRAEPRIVDPDTHPRRTVGLHVAADFLDLDARTLRTRIEEGKLFAEQDGRVYIIAVTDLVAYKRLRRLAS